MKPSFLPTLYVFVIAVIASQAQTSTTKKRAQAASTSPAAESPEHAFARKNYESLKQQLADSEKDYAGRIVQEPDCKVSWDEIPHPVTIAGVEDHMIGCTYQMRKFGYVLAKVTEAMKLAESLLASVDDCARTYRVTIDKKLSDQTTREVEQIKSCQSMDLYPPL